MTGRWRMGHGREMSLDRPRILAIVNCTPDSFSDGGALGSVDAAFGYCVSAIEAGADGLDIGGESTRPGASPVSAGEQIERVVPLIERLRSRGVTAAISVDTTRSAVAGAALDAGADAVNDVSAGLDDAQMLGVAGARKAGVIVMHRRLRPEGERYSDRYGDAPIYGAAEGGLVGTICSFLQERAKAAEGAGVERESIVLDPGLGFGKSVDQNFEIVRRMREICALGYPVLGAGSRKSFVGAVTGVEEPARRIFGSVSVAVAQYLGGARLFRVHDVAAHAEALGVAQAIAGVEE